MLWDYFAAGATGALKKVDEIMRMEECLKILKFHLKLKNVHCFNNYLKGHIKTGFGLDKAG